MIFRNCLSLFCLNDQINTSCMGLLVKGSSFSLAHINRWWRSFTLLNRGLKNWCVATSPLGTRVFERCFNCTGNFIELMQLGLRQRGAWSFQLTNKRPGDLIYIPHLLAHAFLILDTSWPTVSSGYDAPRTTNQQTSVQALDESFLRGAEVWGEFFSYKRFVSIVGRCFLILLENQSNNKSCVQRH